MLSISSEAQYSVTNLFLIIIPMRKQGLRETNLLAWGCGNSKQRNICKPYNLAQKY